MNRMLIAGFHVCLTAWILMALAVSTGWAKSGAHKNYGKISLGMNGFTGDLDDADFDEGVAFSATYGRYLSKYLVIEGNIGYFQTDRDMDGSTSVAGSYTHKDTLNVSSVTGTLKGELPLGPVKLFCGVGVGAYYVSLETKIETSRIGDFDKDDDDVVFGAHVVAGGYYDITPRIFAGVEGMYRWTGDVDMKKNVGTVPVKVNGDLNGYVVTVTTGFRF
jgi:opacity protein-like surface antigen